MKHPNASLLEKIYADFTRGDFPAVLSACGDSITFQVPGKSPLAGKYSRATVASGLGEQLRARSDGTLKMEVHDILASDQHAAVLMTHRLMRQGKPVEYRTVHIWRFEGGKPIAWYEYPRDLYQFDAAWS